MQRPPECACLHNVAATESAADGTLRLWRVPAALLPQLSPKGIERACATAGIELRLRLRSPSLRVTLQPMPDSNAAFASPAACLVGVFHGDFQQGWYAIQAGGTEVAIAPAAAPALLAQHRRRFDPALVRVVLPTFPEVRLVALVGDWAPPAPGDTPARSYLAYGSSITHGAYTPLATETYPAIVGRIFGADVINLGFGGGAKLEPEMAGWIVSRDDWHAASLELGINLLGELDPDAFRLRVRCFLAAFAGDRLRRPVACLDLLPHHDELAGGAAAKTRAFRRVVAEETAALDDPRIRHVAYATALGDITGLSADLLHPAVHGFAALGAGLSARLRRFPAFAQALAQG